MLGELFLDLTFLLPSCHPQTTPQLHNGGRIYVFWIYSWRINEIIATTLTSSIYWLSPYPLLLKWLSTFKYSASICWKNYKWAMNYKIYSILRIAQRKSTSFPFSISDDHIFLSWFYPPLLILAQQSLLIHSFAVRGFSSHSQPQPKNSKWSISEINNS